MISYENLTHGSSLTCSTCLFQLEASKHLGRYQVMLLEDQSHHTSLA